MTSKLEYAGFWKRFAAMWLDALIFLPLIAFIFWGRSRFQSFQLYYIVPGLLIGLFYSVYLVKRYGGTLGKLIMGIRITKTDGTRVGYREAFLRELPAYTLSTLASLAIALATLKLTESEFISLSFGERSVRIMELAPNWYDPVRWAQNIWIWSEFIVLLTNKQRRAIHDFIAGTVVVRKNSNQSVHTTPASAPR